MIKMVIISILICILIILLACIYIGTKSEKVYREIDRPDYIKLEEWK